jgi:hypothetical protein
MEVMHERVAGLDVHKAMIVACVRLMSGGKVERECRTFETTTAGLLALLAWLTQSGCTQVAMEATGDIMGVSGRKMIEAMIGGLRNPVKLAELADRRIKATPKQLYDALHGRLTDHHRFMLKLYMEQYDALAKSIVEIDQVVDAAVSQMDKEVEAGQATFRALSGLLCTIPGVSTLSATTILAEIGTDMSRFPTAGHLLAWAGLCPGQNESAGKRKSSRLRKGAPWLKTMLVQCAWSAVKKKDSYYKAQFNRLRARGGAKKAICAVAASMLTAIYHMLKDGTQHHDLGAGHFDRRSTDIKAKRLVAQLTKLGFQVNLQPIKEAA